MDTFDIVIISNNITSLALATKLKSIGFRILIIDFKKSKKDNNIQEPKILSLINLQSKKFFKQLNIWHNIISINSCLLKQIKIFNQNKINFLSINIPKDHKNYLGYIIENEIIYKALYQNIQNSDDVAFLLNTEIQEILFSLDQVVVKLKNEKLIICKLLINTNNEYNFICSRAEQISKIFIESNYHSLIADIKTEIPHNKTVIQMLCNNGNIICLPMKNPFLMSIIWSLPLNKLKVLQDMSNSLFNKELSVNLNMRLGLCLLNSIRRIIPLKSYYAKNLIDDRMILIGKAAHHIHNFYMQEININLEDVIDLSNEISRLFKEKKDFGKKIFLRRYELKRKYIIKINFLQFTIFNELLSSSNNKKSFLLDFTFKILNNSSYIKNKIINQFL